jgi:hypothetical protein
MEQKAELQPAVETHRLPQELTDLGAWIETRRDSAQFGRVLCPRASRYKVECILRRMARDFKAGRGQRNLGTTPYTPDEYPTMTARIPTKRC